MYLERVREIALRRQVSEIGMRLEQLMRVDQPSPSDVGRLVVLYKEMRDRLGMSVDRSKAL